MSIFNRGNRGLSEFIAVTATIAALGATGCNSPAPSDGDVANSTATADKFRPGTTKPTTTVVPVIAAASTSSAAAQLVIYDDGLSSGWQDWSWGTSDNFQDASIPPKSGKSSAEITISRGDADDYNGFSVADESNQTLLVSSYKELSFYIYARDTADALKVGSLQIYLEDAENAGTPRYLSTYATVAVDAWTEVHIPIGDIAGSLKNFFRVNIQDGTGTGVTFNLDALTLDTVASSAPVVPPVVAPVVATSPTPTISPSTKPVVTTPVTTPVSVPVTVSSPSPKPVAPPTTVTTPVTTTQGARFRGTNLGGMEVPYYTYSQTTGPVAGTDYPVFDTRLIDYLASKGITTLRMLFGWEAMQTKLNGAISNSQTGNYLTYFNNYLRIVNYATNTKGMTVIMEPWASTSGGSVCGACYQGNVVGSSAVPISAFANFWGKMAAVFAGNPRVAFGLINEPNSMSTMTWWSAAQAVVTAIRAAGATQPIYIPGNGWTGASAWTSNWYDSASPARSNAYGWLNANGPGSPLTDPLGNSAVEVHTYLDSNQGGLANDITSTTAARQQIAVTVNEAAAHGYKVYLGEIGVYAGTAGAAAAWADFISYFNAADPDVFIGYTWWAAGDPVWWPDVNAPHFSISPTNATTYTGDTINMQLIQSTF